MGYKGKKELKKYEYRFTPEKREDGNYYRWGADIQLPSGDDYTVYSLNEVELHMVLKEDAKDSNSALLVISMESS